MPEGGPDDEHRHASDPDRAELPDAVLREAERLTRLARRAVDSAEADAYRRERSRVLDAHDYAALVRADDGGEVLVCHPAEWLDVDAAGDAERTAGGAEGDADGPEGHPASGDGEPAIEPERIDDVDRAREVPLDGAADPDGWEAVHERNRTVAERVRADHGADHGANAEALADFASNHYAKPIAALTAAELELFREEYYPRNVWPTEDQRAALDRSIDLVYRALEVPRPTDPDD